MADDDDELLLPPALDPSFHGRSDAERFRAIFDICNRHERRLTRLVIDVSTLMSDRNYLMGNPSRHRDGDYGLIGRLTSAVDEAAKAQRVATGEVVHMRSEWERREAKSARRQLALIVAILVAAIPAILDLAFHFAGQ